MTQFHEDQEVEVWLRPREPHLRCAGGWRKAKIVERKLFVTYNPSSRYEVQFPDSTRAVFEEEHIRDVAGITTIADHAHKFARPEHD